MAHPFQARLVKEPALQEDLHGVFIHISFQVLIKRPIFNHNTVFEWIWNASVEKHPLIIIAQYRPRIRYLSIMILYFCSKPCRLIGVLQIDIDIPASLELISASWSILCLT